MSKNFIFSETNTYPHKKRGLY